MKKKNTIKTTISIIILLLNCLFLLLFSTAGAGTIINQLFSIPTYIGSFIYLLYLIISTSIVIISNAD